MTKAQILAELKGAPSPRVEQVGPYWQIGFAWVSGARKDGIGLARDLMAKYRNEGGLFNGEPVPVEIPAFLKEPEPATDYDAIIADLKAQLAEKQAAHPEPSKLADEPVPAELADLLTEAGVSHLDSYERINTALLPLYNYAKGCAEISRQPDCKGTFNGKNTSEWERKAQAINESIRWNNGRRVETI